MTSNVSTGIPGLDRLIGGLRPGDSIFWCVDDASSYWKLAERFANACKESARGVVCISWGPEDCCRAAGIDCSSSFHFDMMADPKEQLDAFVDFATEHASECFVLGIPPGVEHKGYEESRLMRFLSKVFAQLFWLDSVACFGFCESHFSSDSLTILMDIPRIFVRSNLEGDLTTLRIFKAPGRPMVDTRVVYGLRGDVLTPMRPGEPSLSDFKSIVENSESVVWVLGLDREFAYLSRGALGYSSEELRLKVPELFDAVRTSGCAIPLYSAMDEVLRTGNSVSGIETCFVDEKTGSREYFINGIVPLRDKENRVFGLLGTSTDVTELKKREELLRKSEAELERLAEQLNESERKYSDLFDSAVDVISVIDKQGRLVDVNPACCRLTGYSREELLKMTCADLVDHFSEDRFLEIFEAGSSPWSVRTEYSFVRKDGTQVPLEVSAVMLDADHAVFISRDVSERKIADAKLKASEEMFRSLVRQAGLGISYFNMEGSYLDVNDAMCRMTGFSRDDFLGAKGAHPHWPEESVSRHKGFVKRALSGKRHIFETVFKRKNGELFPVRIHSSPVTDHTGKHVGAIGIMEDVTAWKKLQQQVVHAQRMDVASFLAVGIAHEFNNLHGGIQEYVELILEHAELSPQVHRDLKVVLNTLRRAHSITKQLDTFARQIPPNKAPCHLSEVIANTLGFVSREYEAEGIRVDVRTGRGIPELVIDEAQIGQVLLNLFINARDAMHGCAEKVLRVETGVREKRVVIKVSDTGSGVARAHAKRIFEPFFTTKGKADGKDAHGLGLGLTVSRTIVREHGGDIGVSSKKGNGSTFTIWFPLELCRSQGSTARKGRTKKNGIA